MGSEEGAFEDADKKVGAKHKVRQRRTLIRAGGYGPPSPEPGITSGDCSVYDQGGAVQGPDCVTDNLRCGSTIMGHTIGGTKMYDTRFYERNFCVPALTRHDGGDERVYSIDLGPWERAYVTLDSPCADLDVFALKGSPTDDRCPSPKANVPNCEGEYASTTRSRIDFQSGDNPTRWFVVVEGKKNEEGPFSLTTQCVKQR